MDVTPYIKDVSRQGNVDKCTRMGNNGYYGCADVTDLPTPVPFSSLLGFYRLVEKKKKRFPKEKDPEKKHGRLLPTRF